MSDAERAEKIAEYRKLAESDRQHANFCPSIEWATWLRSADYWDAKADALERELPCT